MSSALERYWYGEGRVAAPARILLWLAARLFGLVVRLRHSAFERGWLRSTRIDGVKVISVGNLNVGGTGKTPTIIFLAQHLHQAGRRVAVLSRGYGRQSREELVLDAASGELPSAAIAGDEPLLIAQRCPGVRVLVGADRVKLARRARDELGVEILLLDDGFQHRRLRRDLDVLVIDEAAGFGNNELLPLGPLREPPEAMARANLIWLKAAGSSPAPLPAFSIPVVRARDLPSGLRSPQGAQLSASVLRGKKVVALAAIARPERFVATLTNLGAQVVERRFFRDHHTLSVVELEEAKRRAGALAAWLVTTEKDLVRLPKGVEGLYALQLVTEVLDGESHLQALLALNSRT